MDSKLVAEVVEGKQIEHEIATIEHAGGISPATVSRPLFDSYKVRLACAFGV
jgi:hypothetical protein